MSSLFFVTVPLFALIFPFALIHVCFPPSRCNFLFLFIFSLQWKYYCWLLATCSQICFCNKLCLLLTPLSKNTCLYHLHESWITCRMGACTLFTFLGFSLPSFVIFIINFDRIFNLENSAEWLMDLFWSWPAKMAQILEI